MMIYLSFYIILLNKIHSFMPPQNKETNQCSLGCAKIIKMLIKYSDVNLISFMIN